MKRRAFKNYKKYPTQQNHNAYARARNQVKWETRKTVKAKELELACNAKLNPKRFYQYVASKTKRKEEVANLLKDNGELTESDEEKANVLNNFFGSVFTQELGVEIPHFSCGQDVKVSDVSISVNQMCKALQGLNSSKSPGPDGLHPRILKELAEDIAYPLKILFDKTMSLGKIPTQWKEAEVRPIFKKGIKNSAGNYRPVSLTSIVCKVFEGFIRDVLCSHLKTNKLLAVEQFGFSKGRSCVTQLLVTVNEWLSIMDNNTPVDSIYLDFKKAFDTVPHRRLISKLRGYGVQGNLLHWVTDFLQQRTQYVNIKGNKSSQISVSSGVPQGSVLGPTLFIYYINDLPSYTDCNIKIFADDTKVYSAINAKCDYEKLQKCIYDLIKWTDTWLLRFNSEKCKVLHLGRNNPKYEYHISDKGVVRRLDSTVAEKDLGVIIDPDLCFDSHINTITKKANQIAGMLCRFITNKSKDVMVPLYKALVRPILEYGNPVWCPNLRKHIDRIEDVQRRFTRKISGTKNLGYEQRLAKLKLPSLEYRRLRGDLIEVFKIMHELYDPCTTSSLFSISEQRATRGHNLKLTKKLTNTRKFQHFFTNRIINHWNKLDDETANASSVDIFKNRLDSSLRKSMFSTKLCINSKN